MIGPRGLLPFTFAAIWLMAMVLPPVSGWYLLGAAHLLFSPSCPDDLPSPDCKCFIPERHRGIAIVCNLVKSKRGAFYDLINRIYDHGGLIDHLLINGCPEPIGELGELPKLKVYHLSITNCGIKSIKPGAFSKSAFWLNRLELDDNELEQLDFGLSKLDQLAWLKVRNNRLSTIPAKTFAHNPLLFNVNLANNRIWWIAGDAFDKPTSALQTLNLRGNRLNALPGDLIQKKSPDDFKQLTTLDLSGNNLQGVVNGELLKGHTNLAVLRLSDNQLTNVTLPTDLKSLRVLDIARNRIVDIDNLPIEELTSMNYLLASGNAIESPDLGGMKERLGSAGFIYLDLSRNGIRSVTSEVLHEVCPSNLIVNLANNWLAGDEFDHCNTWRIITTYSRSLYDSIQLHNDAPIPVKCRDPMDGCSRLVLVLDSVKDMHYKFKYSFNMPAGFSDA